jgi:hypothetical protein
VKLSFAVLNRIIYSDLQEKLELEKMPNSYCVLCGNRNKSVSYYRFPKNEESRNKWLAFCNIEDTTVLNTATKLCSNHFQKDEIIYRAKGSVLKPNAMPSIFKKRLLSQSNVIIHEDVNLKKQKGCHDGTNDNMCLENIDMNNLSINTDEDTSVVDKTINNESIKDKDFDNIDIDEADFDSKSVDKENLEFVSVEDPITSLIGKFYYINIL